MNKEVQRETLKSGQVSKEWGAKGGVMEEKKRKKKLSTPFLSPLWERDDFAFAFVSSPFEQKQAVETQTTMQVWARKLCHQELITLIGYFATKKKEKKKKEKMEKKNKNGSAVFFHQNASGRQPLSVDHSVSCYFANCGGVLLRFSLSDIFIARVKI